jgi:TatD DNase family protein
MLLALGGYFNNEKKPCAIGEVGLDYYRDLSSRDAQMKLFRYFLRLKKKADLPIIIHLRESEADLFGVVDEELALPVDGVVHCFSQGLNGLKAALDRGFFISFTCNITYKNAQTLRDVAKYVPLDRLLLETDAPYLAPQALRGRRNESANLVHLRDALAAVRGVSVDDIEEATTANAVRLFRLNIER